MDYHQTLVWKCLGNSLGLASPNDKFDNILIN